jgi:hypothetical protein
LDAADPEERRVINQSFSLDSFAALSVDAAAARLGTIDVIIEKDFWVVWTLKHLFAMNDSAKFIFKGGTSLSKAFAIIERFSEDIDLIIDRSLFGFTGDDDVAAARSKSERDRRLRRLAEFGARYLSNELVPTLSRRINAVLASPARVEVDPGRPDTVLFYYPTEKQHPYVRSAVQIETGSNADTWPTAQRAIRPYVAESFPEVFTEPDVRVTAIDAARTFWEKLTILHKTAHKLAVERGWEPPARYSRHYYDVYRLSRTSVIDSALADRALIDAVRSAAQLFFDDRRANYGEFKRGTIRLIPSDEGVAALRRDYEAMSDMIFGEYPEFDKMFEELRRIEALINQA